MKDPYGVPTGSVPRMHTNGYQRTEPLPPDPVAKAIEQYLLMERKAQAWDEAVRHCSQWDELSSKWVLEKQQYFVKPAQGGRHELVSAMDRLVGP